MPIEQRRPASREEWLKGRRGSIGASEIAVLFGASPYMTPFELFAIKTGRFEPKFAQTRIEANSIHLPPTERGLLLESSAISLAARLRPQWSIRSNEIPGGVTFVDVHSGLSSTPDAFIIDQANEARGQGSLQIKTASEQAFREQWIDGTGAIDPPPYVMIQAIADATLSGSKWASIGVMVIGWAADITFHLIDIPMKPKLMEKAHEIASDFWRRVANNDPYPPDFGRDEDVIKALYSDDDGGSINLADNLRVPAILSRRAELKAIESSGNVAEKERKTLDAEIIFWLGNAAVGILPGGALIEARTIRRKGYEVAPSQYRQVKIKEGTNGSGAGTRGTGAQQTATGPF